MTLHVTQYHHVDFTEPTPSILVVKLHRTLRYDRRMPPHFNLRRSTAHRVACKKQLPLDILKQTFLNNLGIALYRALLSQCPRIYIPDERWRGPINPIKHLIRKRFQKQKYQQSQRIVVQSLKFGYQVRAVLNLDSHLTLTTNATI